MRYLKKAGLILFLVILSATTAARFANGEAVTPTVEATPFLYVSDEDLAFIREELVPGCVALGCSQEDFFPLVNRDGTISPTAAIYWPRGECAILIEKDALCKGIFFLHDEVTPDDLQDPLFFTPLPCEIDCEKLEYFPLLKTYGSRIATSEADIPFVMDIPDDVLLLVWRDEKLESHYGPKSVELTPHSAWWHISTVG